MLSWTLPIRRALAALAATALAVLTVLAVGSAPAEAVRPPGIPSTATAQSELNALTVAAESHGSTYDRSLFPHWRSVSGTGSCTARQHILKRDGQNVTCAFSCESTRICRTLYSVVLRLCRQTSYAERMSRSLIGACPLATAGAATWGTDAAQATSRPHAKVKQLATRKRD